MSMPSFQMSQTGKILVGVLLAAAAIFFWVNFFLQSGTPQGTVPSQTPTTEQSAAAPGAIPASITDSTTDSTTDSATGAPTGDGSADAPSVDVPALEVATRDIVVADLPFLVTEPVARESATGETAETADAATGAARPESNLRATINPFSPVVLPPQPAAQPVAQPAAPPEPVTDVPVPDAPQPVAADPAPPEPVAAPAPAALAPPSPRTAELPRALPAGTLPSTPSLLRRARNAPQTPPLDEVIGATSGAVRVPDGAEQPRLDTARADAQASEPVAGADLAPLGPGANRRDAADADAGGVAPAADPLAAGVTPLSSYLRDNNVTFTGAVLGPVSVGVFRSAETRNPIVIALGSPLPETDIVLTDLRGQQAQFTRGDAQQILTLNLRR